MSDYLVQVKLGAKFMWCGQDMVSLSVDHESLIKVPFSDFSFIVT